jgi:flagellar hook assembly protein FlgD
MKNLIMVLLFLLLNSYILADTNIPAGEHSAIWNGRDSNDKRVGSGIYFYKLKAGDYQKVKKMILLK